VELAAAGRLLLPLPIISSVVSVVVVVVFSIIKAKREVYEAEARA
jgi:hypothetical protein